MFTIYLEEIMKVVKPIYKKQDYTGKKIGSWTVTGYAEYIPTTKGGRYNWECICECGTKKVVNTTGLLYGRTTQCINCSNKERKYGKEKNPNWKGFGEVSGEVLHRVRESTKRKSRLLEIDVDCEYLNTIWLQQNRKCAYTNRPLVLMKTASLDRIDSSKGYVKGNVEWVHKDVNKAKMELSEKAFIKLCKEVASWC